MASKRDRLLLELVRRRGLLPDGVELDPDALAAAGTPLAFALAASGAASEEAIAEAEAAVEALAFACSACGVKDYPAPGAPQATAPVCDACAAKRSPHTQRAATFDPVSSAADIARRTEKGITFDPVASIGPTLAPSLPTTPTPVTKTPLRTAGSSARLMPARPGPPSPAPLPAVLGGCRIERAIAEGGMGRLYRAHHLGLDRPMAIKVLSERLLARPGAAEVLFAEARALAKLDHANIVRVFNADRDPSGVVFIATELIEGAALDDAVVAAGGKLPLGEAVRIIKEAAAGLHHAHAAGLLHRDVKPSNVMLAAGGRVKVIDFGLAVPLEGDSFQSRKLAGTPLYMSPEQADRRRLDARSDQYSLGATFYELLCGRPVFDGQGLADLIVAHVSQAPDPPSRSRPDVPAWLDAVVLGMLAKDPDRRFASLADVIEALERGAAAPTAAPSAAPPPARTPIIAPSEIAKLSGGRAPRPVKPPSWRPALAACLASVALGAAFVAGPGGDVLARPAPLGSVVVARRVDEDREKARRASPEELVELARRAHVDLDAVGELPGAPLLDQLVRELDGKVAQARAAARSSLEERVGALLAAKRQAAAVTVADPTSRAIVALGLADVAGRLRDRARTALLSERGEVLVPGGVFRSGPGGKEAATGAFTIDRTEVTVEAYAAVADRERWPRPPGWPAGPIGRELARKPATGVTFDEAAGYAKALGKRLPTAAEWEKAARGALDRRAYPWGDVFASGRANVSPGAAGVLEDVDARPGDESPFGVLGAAGNAAEWVVGASGEPLVAGGSAVSTALAARVFARSTAPAGTRDAFVGFRCARDVDGP